MTEEKTGYPSTEKLYFENAYLKEFSARVIGREIRDGQRVVVLDRTAFYPESGGQPHDTGLLNGVKIIKVEEEDGIILHYLEGELAGMKFTVSLIGNGDSIICSSIQASIFFLRLSTSWSEEKLWPSILVRKNRQLKLAFSQ